MSYGSCAGRQSNRGKCDEVVQLDKSVLNKIIQEKQGDDDLLDALENYMKLEQTKRLYLSKIKNGTD